MPILTTSTTSHFKQVNQTYLISIGWVTTESLHCRYPGNRFKVFNVIFFISKAHFPVNVVGKWESLGRSCLPKCLFVGGKILTTLFWVGGSRLAKLGSLQRLFYVPAFVLGQRFSVFVCLRLIRVKCFTYFGLFYSVCWRCFFVCANQSMPSIFLFNLVLHLCFVWSTLCCLSLLCM